eukprot:Gregarina_sp_Poly_1__8519@NODE_502_length_7877_cov_467_844558_g402_i0_p2_GENE_NODE_502_length_7877_cov_467_844558_g402_i0NODE_502_length_7877_cov_467_844558_g402_i0_p2_ORF_typecomplete_len486_score49_75LPMO_10/PF03067_15/4_9e17LPMO_10/PF03067_15/1_8e04SDA1/PF05285_12/0_59GCIP/PF13324_6/1_9Sigma70_ner/PF04546_13/1_5Hid1/PF12722_7/3_7Nop14/PF04147_12/3_5_NODE_502_length_7877_cov_467_844558_g402_i042145671
MFVLGGFVCTIHQCAQPGVTFSECVSENVSVCRACATAVCAIRNSPGPSLATAASFHFLIVRMVSLWSLIPIALVLVDEVAGHGAMKFPVTRNVHISHYCPQCANGSNSCGAGGNTQWPADPADSVALNGGYTTPLTELVAGGMVEVEVFLTAAHQGHFALELCVSPGSTITDDCFVRLQRDPDDTRFTPYASSASWAAIFPENGCATTFSQNAPMKVRFIVPNSVSDHAVLRWYWQSGNSCDSLPETSNEAPSAVTNWSASINGKSCKASISRSGRLCGSGCPHSGCTNEQFKNCADVRIVTGDSNVIVTSSGKEVGSGSSNGNGSNTGNGNNGEGGVSGGNNSNGDTGNGNSGTGNSNENNHNDQNGHSNHHDHDDDDDDHDDHDDHDDDRDDDDDDDKHQEHHDNAESNQSNTGSGKDWTRQINDCKDDVEGKKSGWDKVCSKLCEEIAVAGSPQQMWCLQHDYTRLAKCVYKFYNTICEED